MAAAWSSDPITMRSGCRKSCTAEPSRRNSGFEATSKSTPFRAYLPITERTWPPVRTGTVLFSTIRRYSCSAPAMSRETASMKDRSAPPDGVGGVGTEMKITLPNSTASALLPPN